MAWFLACVDGADAGSGSASIGWHSEPGVARTEERWSSASQSRSRLGVAGCARRLGARGRAITRRGSRVDELDASSQAWATRRGFVEIGRDSLLVLDLGGDLGTRASTRRKESRSRPGRSGLTRSGHVRGRVRDISGRTGRGSIPKWIRSRVARERSRGTSDRPEATFVAFAGTRSSGTRSSRSPRRSGHGVPRHDRRQASGGARHRRRAQARGDRVGEARGLRPVEDHNEARNSRFASSTNGTDTWSSRVDTCAGRYPSGL